MNSEDQNKAAEVISSGIVADIGLEISEAAPEWVEEATLPGLEELDAVVLEIKEEIRLVELKLAQADEKRSGITLFRNLLWGTGKYQLEPVVRDAFSLLGFEAADEGNNHVVLFDGGVKVAIVEIYGSNGQIIVNQYRQLLDYVEDELQESDITLKGILVGNGYRFEAPDDRADQFTEACRRGANRQEFCLLSTIGLFAAVKAVLEDPSDELKTQIRKDILTTTGDYKTPVVDPSNTTLNSLESIKAELDRLADERAVIRSLRS